MILYFGHFFRFRSDCYPNIKGKTWAKLKIVFWSFFIFLFAGTFHPQKVGVFSITVLVFSENYLKIIIIIAVVISFDRKYPKYVTISNSDLQYKNIQNGSNIIVLGPNLRNEPFYFINLDFRPPNRLNCFMCRKWH